MVPGPRLFALRSDLSHGAHPGRPLKTAPTRSQILELTPTYIHTEIYTTKLAACRLTTYDERLP
jgi:hypothetical protein|uniref:Uncharacterized protein n=1 Tax=Zea mays TaxID=4577 RepID=C4J890_MAIZE|nr:unknown [Zea mays]